MDRREIGRQAGTVLDNEAFRAVCETIQDDLRKAFLSDDEAKAMGARAEARAIEKILTRLARMKARTDAIIRDEKSEQRKREAQA